MASRHRLPRTTRLLASLTVGLAPLNGRGLLRYQPWARLPLRLTYTDAHGYPVHSDSSEFRRHGQLLTGFDGSFRGLTDSSQHRAAPYRRGTWLGAVSVDGRVLPLPTELRVNYTFLAEGRSYQGTFQLTGRVLDGLLTEVRHHPDRYQTLFTPGEKPGLELQAGLAPGGVVVVQLLGENYAAEVACFRARPYPTRWPRPAAYPDTLPYRDLPALRRRISRAKRAHLELFPRVPLGHWDTLRQRYPYRLRVLAALRPQLLHVRCLNQDEQDLPAAGQPAGPPQPLPDFVQHQVQDPRFAHPCHTTGFDAAELRRAFATLPRLASGECYDLLVQPTPTRTCVVLKKGHLAVALTRGITRVDTD